jgi:hypothetical protein
MVLGFEVVYRSDKAFALYLCLIVGTLNEVIF